MPERSLRWVQDKTLSSRREKSSRVAALEESGVATRDILSVKQGEKYSGIYWEESQVEPGGESVHQKRKIMSGSCLGGVWGCYPGYCVSKTEDKRL